MSRRDVLANLIMSTTVATAGAAGCRAADWSETLEASANTAYVTNPQLLPGSSTADRLGVLTLDGNTSVQTERTQLSVTPRFSATRYARDSALNIDTGSIDISSLGKVERGQWTVNAQGLADTTLTSELGLTGITSVNRRHESGSVAGSYQYFSSERLSWLSQGTWAVTRYSDAQRFGLTNYDYASLQFGPTWSFSERLQGSLTLETDRITPKRGTAQNEYSASVQLKRSISERLSWRASAGTARIDFGAGAGTSALLELGASRHSERIQWDVSLRRAVTPIGVGLLARTDQAALAAVAATSEHSTLNVSLSVIRSAPVTLLQYRVYNGASWEQLGAEWQWHFSAHWVGTVAVSEARSHIDGYSAWANGNQARIGLLWQSGRL